MSNKKFEIDESLSFDDNHNLLFIDNDYKLTEFLLIILVFLFAVLILTVDKLAGLFEKTDH